MPTINTDQNTVPETVEPTADKKIRGREDVDWQHTWQGMGKPQSVGLSPRVMLLWS